MSQTQTATKTATYTIVDIEKVVRRVRADLVMIGDSTGGWTSQEANQYAHDIELLATAGYLQFVDITLFSNGVEVKATRFDVDTDAGGLTSSKPGGVLWPRVHKPFLRVVLRYTSTYTAQEKEAMKKKLEINWSPSDADTTHSSLKSTGGRDYSSNSYGIQRKDWAS